MLTVFSLWGEVPHYSNNSLIVLLTYIKIYINYWTFFTNYGFINIFFYRLFQFRSSLLSESRLIYIPVVTKIFQFTTYKIKWFPTREIQLSKYLQLTFRFNLRPRQLLPKSSIEYLFLLSFFIIHMRRLELLSSTWKAESLPANLHM